MTDHPPPRTAAEAFDDLAHHLRTFGREFLRSLDPVLLPILRGVTRLLEKVTHG